jgi:hypothetical protein
MYVRVPVGGEADARRLSESIFPSSFVVYDANYLRVGGRRPLSTLHLARLRGTRPFPGAVQACVVEQAPDTLRLWCSCLISQLHYLLAQMYHMREALGVSSLPTIQISRGSIHITQVRAHTQADRRGPRLERGRGVWGVVGRSRLRLSDCMMAPRVKDAGQRRHSHTPTHAGTHIHPDLT